LLNSNTSSTCPHNMVNFGLLTAEICWRVWGTPAHFQRLSHLDSVTARHSMRQPNFAASNRGRHLYSAGRPSRWALAHILVDWLIASCVVSVQLLRRVQRSVLRLWRYPHPRVCECTCVQFRCTVQDPMQFIIICKTIEYLSNVNIVFILRSMIGPCLSQYLYLSIKYSKL